MLWVVRRAQEEGRRRGEGRGRREERREERRGVVLLLSLLAAPFNQVVKTKMCIYICGSPG